MPNGFLYRWEDHNHGLEHKCGTCATVLSSPRAKKTCFGIHEEVCTRYHKTLFYVGQSHHCDACHKSIELHDKRHRQIAEIIQTIHRLDRDSIFIFSKKKGKKAHKNGDDLDFDLDPPGLRTIDEEGGEENEGLNWDNQSGTLNEENADDIEQPRDDADARKATKAERKAAKNQVRFDIVTKEDLDRIQAVLHPEIGGISPDEHGQGQGLFDNSTIDNNIAFNTRTFKYSSLRKGIHAKKLLKNNGSRTKRGSVDPELVEEMSLSILTALGITPKPLKAPKERRSLETKLRNAIMNDLIAFENEQAETMERMAGYWRYVNRRTYNTMVENNELWDWATGQKLCKVEEESELDAIEEEDESAEEETLAGSTSSSTPLTSPEKLDKDGNFEFPPDSTPLFDRRKIFTADRDTEGFQTPTQATYARYNKDPDALTALTKGLTNLSFSPGQSPGPTLTFKVPSPHANDDDPYEGDWEDCDTPSHTTSSFSEASTRLNSPLLPVPPKTTRPLFDGKKDLRATSGAIFIRNASPPLPPPAASQAPSRWRKDKTLAVAKGPSPSTILPISPEININNRFEKLEREIPAPRDEPKKPNAKKAGAKAKVLNVALPVEPAALEAEDGWAVMGGGGKRNGNGKERGFPPIDRKGGKKGVVKGGKGGVGGKSWANVVAGGGGKRR